ncbi:PQQ-binding-like beta-propeller repeat protein [Altererythrobacter endophyticus]|uniref:PQQ-binding-like beta-propeller repeat protein n=1 Tax=Altericroceibacterium endophyticum TaxID=1808508 RepID=A0A6I4T0W5_9SPHN|nr:PQQ-binding-like beta-propeller repeat protein [Altericroceibacterium endophyticum]
MEGCHTQWRGRRYRALSLAHEFPVAVERHGRDQAAIVVPDRLRHEFRRTDLAHIKWRDHDFGGAGHHRRRVANPARRTGGDCRRLLFVGTATDRAFRARDADTGEILWEHRLDAATKGVPAIFEVDGRQFITVPVGGLGLFAGGLGLPEPEPSRYVTFALPPDTTSE